VTSPSFDSTILDAITHRPWPLPTSPWIMTQTWHDLLFAHWPIAASALASHVPSVFQLDSFDGTAWVGVVPFHMSNVRPRGVPALPWLSAFPELNVRTYVVMDDKPGVYFFSLDATNPLAVKAARRFFHLPYYTAEMTVESRGHRIHYRSRRTSSPPAELIASYGPTAPPAPPRRGTLEYFLTERYCLYTLDRRGRPARCEIHHPAWPLQTAEADIAVNTMASAAGLELPHLPPLLHFSRRQDVVVWPLTRVDGLRAG
jgi:uncharacterized protein YqjF (DUF2071 family)